MKKRALDRLFDFRWATSDAAQPAFTALALVCLLLYTGWHTAALMARYVGAPLIGWIAAAGIEFAIVAFSLRIGQKRRAAKADAQGRVRVRGTGRYAFVIAAALVVSALANLSEGYAASHQGAAFTLGGLAALDRAQAVILIAATALISVLVYSLSDIIGGDVRTAAEAAERAERKERAANETASEPPAPASNIVALPNVKARWTCAKCGREYAKQPQLAAHEWRCKGAQAQEAGR